MPQEITGAFKSAENLQVVAGEQFEHFYLLAPMPRTETRPLFVYVLIDAVNLKF